MKWTLAVTGSLLTVLLLALAGILLLLTTVSLEIDGTPYKEYLIPAVQKHTGLAVGIDGEIRLETGPRLGLRVDGLQVANPVSTQSPELLAAELAVLRIETAALLAGELRPIQLELEGASLLLELDPEGRPNWRPSAAASPAPDASVSGLGWLVTDSLSVHIRDTRLIYSDRRAPSELQIELTRVEIVPDGQRLRVDLDGSLNSQPLRMTGSTATLAQLIAAEGSVPIDLSGVVLGLKIDAKGELAFSKTGVAMDATFSVAGDSLAELRPWIGDLLADGGPVRASVALQGVGQSIDISRLDIELGKRRLQGKMSASFAEAGTVRVRDGALGYTDGRSGTSWKAEIASASVTPGEDALRFDFDGKVDGQAIRLRGKTAALPARAASKASIPVELSGDVLGLRVEVKGKLADPKTGAAMDATLSVAGKSLAGLRPWVGDALAGLGRVKAKLTVKGGGNAYRLAPFELAVGKGRFDGSLSLDLSGTRPRVDLDLGIAEVDIRPLFKGTKVVADPPTQASRGSGRLFSETPLQTSWLGAADVAARVHIRNLVTPYNTGRSVDIEARLQARRLRVDLAGRAIGNRSVTAKLEIDGTAEPPAARLGIQGDKLMIAPLVAGTVAGGMIEGDMDLSLDASAAGTSSAELARSLSGKLLVLIEQAQADLTHLNRLTPGVRDLLGQLAQPKRKLARVNCGVAAFEFQGGRTQVRSLVDTPDSTTVAHGYVDFGAETLEPTFRTPPVKISAFPPDLTTRIEP